MNLSKRRKKLSTESFFTHRCSDGTLVECRHIKKRGLKNLNLRLQEDGKVRITTPWNIPTKEVERFVAQKEKWIMKRHSHRLCYSRSNPRQYDSGCRIWYLGSEYKVEYRTASRSRIDFINGHFLFSAPETEKFSEALERFYRREAKKIFEQRVAIWSRKMKLFPTQIRFRRYKSRWGCCRSDGVITFNTALLRYDIRLIDYVIIHELAHLRHRHHKKEFWDFVGRFEPDYKQIRKMLV